MDSEIEQAIAAQRPYLLAIASKWLRSGDRTEDAVQSTLLAALIGASKYRGKASLRTWLTAILRNRIVDEHRRIAREPLATDLGAEAPDSHSWADPAAEVEAMQTATQLQRRLNSLPAACSEAFVMHELEGHRSDAVRARLDLTPDRLWQCLHRARRKLRAAT
jgi:RNA polymerase sigma-70 factor (ECF subfamily)